MKLIEIGGLFFGLVIGWITYRTLRRREGATQLSDIATVLAALGGATVTALPFGESNVFGLYAIGLAIGFFGYLFMAVRLAGNDEERVGRWMGD
jgi:NhaP-type Na+/H+ or K+/H+ antiporter